MSTLNNSKKKILLLTTVPATLQAFLLPIASELKNKGWQIDAGAANINNNKGSFKVFDNCYEISWKRNIFNLKNLKALIELRKHMKKYNIVHVHTPIAAFLTRLSCALFGFRGKLIYTAHGFHFNPEGKLFGNTAFLIAEKIAGLWTDSLVVINDQDYKAATKFKLVPSGSLIRMYGIGIDTDFFNPAIVSSESIASLRNRLRIPSKAPLFTLIAEFNKNKRHIDLIEALSIVTKKKDVYVLFIGDGPLFFTIKRIVEKLNLTKYTRFLGSCRDKKLIRCIIKASSALILPSLREGLPVSVLEALSMEIPVVGTDIRGTQEVLSDGCGILIKTKSPQILAEALLSIIDNPKIAEKMGKKGRKKMLGKYNIKNITSQHIDIYENLLKQ